MLDAHASTTPPALDTSLPDMQLAIQGMQHALLVMQDEIARQSRFLEHLQQQKRQWLETQVAGLLPGFSASVLDALVLACPGFVDDVVRAVFRENRKLLGLFAQPGAAVALTSLQVRLAFFLDQQKGAEIHSADEKISSATEEKQKLEKLHYETQAAIQMLASYQSSGHPIPADVQAYIRQMAERARQIAAQQAGVPANDTRQDNISTHQQGYDNAAYPWLYYSHDIGLNFSHAAAPTAAVPASQHKTEEHAASDLCPPEQGQHHDARDTLACHADDRLGAYS
ncbi:hypothetical protein [Undibacterium umbellatum]|uniref:Uncharacterized protein n=1 Tax=Undibacterium umbellatum TaxID=2762300 RepID=A0ABR6ZCW5_9BURK|nr:hypothetical protein [Undibacterium umbellatum]MBC3909568.1 hypothetical protein [Undibacterium umbellatum]